MTALMIRTGIPISVWEAEGQEAIETALRLLSRKE